MQTNTHIGRLIKSFELQHVGNESVPMVRFGLAVKRFASSKSDTDFIYYVAFNKTAEMLYRYANTKGMSLEVRFNMQSKMYTNKDGKSTYQVTNIVESFMPWSTNKSHENSTEKTETAQDIATLNDDYFGGLSDVLPAEFNVE